jgi:drug/metabolite transporter (DMT)-like permease
MGRRDVGVVAAFGAVWIIWGSTYLAIAWAVESISPFVMIGVRCVAAGAVLYGWGRVRGGPRPRGADWRAAARSGFLLFVTGQAVLAWAETRVPSGVASLLVATEPLFIALLSWRAGNERGEAPSARAVLAIVAGFVGVGALLLPGSGGLSLDPLAAGAIVLAALSWSLGMLGAAARPGFGAAQTAGMQLVSAGVMLLVLSLGVGGPGSLPAGVPSLRSLAALAYLVVFGSIIAFGAYVWLLGQVSPQLVATHAYVNPLVAVAVGTALNHEPITGGLVAAGAVVVGSVAMLLRGTAGPGSAGPRKVGSRARVPELSGLDIQ